MTNDRKKTVGSMQELEKLLGQTRQGSGLENKLSDALSSATPARRAAAMDELIRKVRAKRRSLERTATQIEEQKSALRQELGQLKLERHTLGTIRGGISKRRQELSSLRSSLKQEIAQLRKAREETAEALETAKKITNRTGSLEDLTEILRDLEDRQKQLKAELEESKERRVSLDRLSTTLKSREQKLDRAEERHKKQRRVNRELKAEVGKQQTENEALHRQILSFKRKTTRLENQIEKQRAMLRTMDIAQQGIDWLLQNAAEDDAFVLRPEVVLVGSGPIAHKDMRRFLKQRGISVSAPNSAGVPFMVVGREDWSEEELEKQIAAREGDWLHVYSQEMALLALAAGADPLDSADEQTLLGFAEGHSALEFLHDSELAWPLTAVPAIPEEFTPFGHEERGVDESPLKKMGYTVGKTNGLVASARQKIISQAFGGELPFTHSEEYMQDWGHPRTRRRLWRMSNHLAWLAKSWKRLPSHRYAVKDWTTDLAYLKRQYYRPWMKFAWPHVRVPGK